MRLKRRALGVLGLLRARLGATGGIDGERGGLAIGEFGAFERGASDDAHVGFFDDFFNKRWAELIAAAIGVAIVVYLFYLYTRFPLPPGTDTGQWLTISRYYLFQDVPGGRSMMAVPPIVPASLAVLSLFSGPTGAPVMLAAICYAAFCAMAFVLGRRLSGSASGGLLALVAVCVVQGQLFEFFAMGAFPQLVALLGMSACMYALFGLAAAPEDRRSWLTLAAGVGVTLFSHTPSSTVLIPVLAISIAYVAWSAEDRRAVGITALKIVGPVAALWLVFVFINRDVVFGYANVPAAFDLKGPDKLFDNIWRNNTQRVIFGVGLVMAIALPFLMENRRGLKSNPAVVLSLWTVALIGVVAAAAARHAGTDYPRFAAYFIVPLGVAAAAGVQSLNPSRGATIAVLVPVLLFAGNDGMQHFNTATRFYGMNERADDLTDVAAWFDTSADNGGVIGGTRETKWLEALTGRDSLLYLPRIYITRPWEVDRALQAEVVLRSSGGIETGRMLVTANDGGEDYGKVFPAGVRVDAFEKGLYTHAFTMRDTTTSIVFEAANVSQKVSLGSLVQGGTTSYHDAAGEHLVTRFDAKASPLQIYRVVSASSLDLDVVNVDYYIGVLPGVRPSSVMVGTGDPGNVEIKPGQTFYFYPLLANGEYMEVEAQTSWLGTPVPPAGANPFLQWRKATIRMDVGDGEHRIPRTELYAPLDVLHGAGVRYIVDRNGDGAAFPIIRRYSLQPVYQNEEYRVYEVP
ncbi:MAG TPA: hypothetical protein VIH21_07255 [Dehalococcoidia bacterium]